MLCMEKKRGGLRIASHLVGAGLAQAFSLGAAGHRALRMPWVCGGVQGWAGTGVQELRLEDCGARPGSGWAGPGLRGHLLR